MSTKAKRAALKVAEALKVVKKTYDHALSELKAQIDELELEVVDITNTMERLPESLLQFGSKMRICSDNITKRYGADHALVASATVESFSEAQKETFSDLPLEMVTIWKNTIMEPLHEWGRLFVRLQEKYEVFDTVRMQYNHYTRKVQSISDERAKRKAKGKTVSAKQEKQWERNKEKLRISTESFNTERTKLLAQSKAIIATKYPRLNLVFRNVMTFQLQFFQHACTSLEPLKQTLTSTIGHMDERAAEDETNTRAALDLLNRVGSEVDAAEVANRRLSMASIGVMSPSEPEAEDDSAAADNSAAVDDTPVAAFVDEGPALDNAAADPFSTPSMTPLVAIISDDYDSSYDTPAASAPQLTVEINDGPRSDSEPPSPNYPTPPAITPPSKPQPRRKGAFEWSDKYELWFNPKNGFFFNEKSRLYTKDPGGNAWYRHDPVTKKLTRVIM